MKPFNDSRFGLHVAILCGIYALAACNQPQPSAIAFAETDKEAIRTNLTTFMSTDPIDNPEPFFSQVTDDVYFIYGDEDPWVGMQGFRQVDWCHTITGNIEADHIEGEGNLAYARGTYTLSLNCKGDTVDSHGVFLSVHQKQADGSWKIKSMLEHNK